MDPINNVRMNSAFEKFRVSLFAERDLFTGSKSELRQSSIRLEFQLERVKLKSSVQISSWTKKTRDSWVGH